MRYYTSDWHIGHANVARRRGFEDVADHDDWVARMLHEPDMGRGDTLYVLGDVTLKERETSLGILSSLRCDVHLIAGNHDEVHPMHRKALNAHKKWLRGLQPLVGTVDVIDPRRGFDTISSAQRMKLGGDEFLLSHFPYAGDHEGTPDRYVQWRLRDMGLPLLHGHVHDEWARKGNMLNVSVDSGRVFSDEDVGDLLELSESAHRGWLKANAESEARDTIGRAGLPWGVYKN